MKIPIGTLLTFIISSLAVFVDCFPRQLTFELPGTERLCFYEKLEKQEQCSFMFQVLKGSSSDIEVIIRDPSTKIIVKKEESPHETIELTALADGDYSFCFHNRFPPMSPKRIFFELRLDESLREEAGLLGPGPSTMIGTLAESIHEHLSVSESYQTELRAKLTADRIFAHELLSHITIWSTAVSVIIIVTVVAQVSILKSFFKDRERHFTTHNSY